MKQAIGYLRQSTTKQQSLAAQKQTIKALAKKHNIPHITFYSDKQSGRTDKRNGYQQITELIQQGQCDVLCCYRLNRLHRNLKNALKLMKLCQTYHVHILSVHDGYFDMDKAFDRLKLNIFISLAELESDNIGEQVSNGIKEKARQGKLITTHAPFGYHYKRGTFTINKNESPTVIAVFNYYLQGNGYKKITQFLEEDNKLLNRKPYQVRNIIMNPNYCGRVINKYGQYDNMFPSIVSTNMYEQAQALRSQKQIKRTPSDNQLKQKISQEILDEYDKYLIKPMDIVISTRSSELKIAIVNESLARNNIIISSNFNILRVKDNKISPYYLFAFLTSQIGTEQFEQLMTGTVINVISQKALQEYKVSLLGQESQEDIAFKMEEELVEYYSYLNKIQRFHNKLPQLFHKNGGE